MSAVTASNPRIRPVIELFKEMGLHVCAVHYTKHWKVEVEYPVGKHWTITVAGSPSDRRSLLNLKADVRRTMRHKGEA